MLEKLRSTARALLPAISLLIGTAACEGKPQNESTKDRWQRLAADRDSVDVVRLQRDGEDIPHGVMNGAAFLSNGSVAFAEQHEMRIVLFDAAGQFLADAGQKGSGPGEFQAIARVVRLRDDSIGIYDPILRRISVFDARLTFVRSIPQPLLPDERAGTEFVGQFADGSMLMLTKSASARGIDGVQTHAHALIAVNDDGSTRRLELPPTRMLHMTFGNTTYNRRVPETAVREVAVCDRGVVTIADHAITVHDEQFRRLHTPPFRGVIDTLEDADRNMYLQVHPTGNDADTRRLSDAVRAAQPELLVIVSQTRVAADGVLWFQQDAQLNARHIRTTLDGTILDTLLMPYWPVHGNDRVALASGSHGEDSDPPGVLVKQRSRGKPSEAITASAIGRCNAKVWY